MSAVSLTLAKQYLRIDAGYTAEDELIQLMIDAAENDIEVYTSHVLAQRDYTLVGAGCEERVYLYPIADISEDVKHHTYALYTSFDLKKDVSTTFKVGYASYEDIPKQLITAVLKQVTYMFENRDTYEAALHTDVKSMINQLRRAIVAV